jgi:hypothetical protein
MRKPANPKLYAMFVAQARAKYSNYPNPGASAWVSKKYQQAGGQYVETTEATRRANMTRKKQENAKNKERESKKEVKNSKKEKDKGNK